MGAFQNLAGQKFGRLLVVSERPVDRVGVRPEWRWLCRCDCGTELRVTGACLRKGNSKSCGCLKRDVSRARHLTHGGTSSRTWTTWMSMRARCTNPTNPAFPRYGGRGISICPEWSTYEVFLRDMGERPVDRSLDRIDNDGNYEPGNCRWATRGEQRRNALGVCNVTIGPLTMCLKDWAAESGKSAQVIKYALLRGDPPARAVYG